MQVLLRNRAAGMIEQRIGVVAENVRNLGCSDFSHDAISRFDVEQVLVQSAEAPQGMKYSYGTGSIEFTNMRQTMLAVIP